MKFAGTADDQAAATGELLEHEPLAAAEALPQAAEGDVEVDAGLGGDEGVLLGEPGGGAIELEHLHLAGQHAREGQQPVAAGGVEVAEGERLAGHHPLARVHRAAQQTAETAATSAARGLAARLSRTRLAELRLHLHVGRAEQELAGLAVDDLIRRQVHDGHLHRVAADGDVEHGPRLVPLR
ncbi:hypothetical protein GCM10027265_31040 [Jatrophihabitans fulvus]